MTPEQQRIAIAEWCGWKFFCVNCLGEHVYHGPNGQVASIEEGNDNYTLPDYLEDLNAMWQAEHRLPVTLEIDYWRNVQKAVRESNDGEINQFIVLHATAAQRAEALLRTIGKWEE